MSKLPEMTRDEVTAHAVAIAMSQAEGQFVVAFAAYVKDVVERETDPYEKIALFVHGMIEGQHAMLTKYRGGGAA